MVLAFSRLAGAFVALALVLGAPASLEADPRPVIAAASDLQFALTEIAERFEAETGSGVRLNFGSSGNFARQIRQGAPFELYLSADEDFVLDLARDGLVRDQGALYAVGRIVIIVPPGSPVQPDGSLDNLRAALEAGTVSRIAIANPEHAPYGRAAREALQATGLWEMVEPRLVLGENVSQAAQFVVSGNAEAGIVAYSLALADSIGARTEFALIPEGLHARLNQRMALVKGASPMAGRFYHYLKTPEAREIFRRYGFALPGERDS